MSLLRPYWWHRGALTVLPRHRWKGKVNFIPPDELLHLLNSIS